MKIRKRICMITPENAEINTFRKKQFNNFIQITMPYLAGYIDESKYEITLIDEYNQKIPYDRPYDLVAITVNTPNAVHCYTMARLFRKQGSKVVMGGPHVTLLPDEAREHCDYIMVGEAEDTWPRFLEDFYHGRAASRYECKETPSLNGLPVPRRDLVKRRFLTKGAVFATRGCPYYCSYCNLKQIYCDSFRTRPIPEVLEDIKQIKSKHFVFWDDNFFGDAQYSKELLKAMAPLKKKWAAQVTLERCQDEELLKIAKAAGCTYLFVGLESFSKEGLASVNKGFNPVEKYQKIIDSLHRNRISIQAGIIFGMDSDTADVFDNTVKACNVLGIDGATVSILTPLPGTGIFQQMKEENRLLTEDWTFYNGKTRVAFKPKGMTADELFCGYIRFRKQFYSLKSISKRLFKSKTNILYNLILNLGYKLSISGTHQRSKI